MKKLFLALVMALALLVPTGAASADEACLPVKSCGSIYHYTPDSGRDTPILVRCDINSGPWLRVYEGQSSRRHCNDTDAIWNRAGEEIWCKMLVGSPSDQVWVWQRKFDATGSHKIDNWWNDGQGCTIRAD